MRHLGTRQLETERLILRRIRLDDAPIVYQNWAKDPEVTRYLTWPPHESVAVTRAVVENWLAEYAREDYYHWGLELKENGQLIGTLAVIRQDEQLQSFDLGYCIGRGYWGRSLMPEALRAVADFLFGEVGANRIEANHYVENPKSGRVMQKAGMRFEGTKRQAGMDGQRQLHDIHLYAILREDWLAARPAESGDGK